MVHAFLELDVTLARQLIRRESADSGKRLSFTAFVVASAARAIATDRLLHASRDWRGRLVWSDDVDVVTLIEPAPGAVAVPHVIRAADKRSVDEIHTEIRRVQVRPAASKQRSGLLVRASRFTPGVARRAFFRLLRRNPRWLKRTAGTTLVTAVGMFGAGRGWAVGIVPLHTSSLIVGGIVTKPAYVDGRIEPREFLALTVSVDHDIVDGAPAARFVRRLREIIEMAEVLVQPA